MEQAARKTVDVRFFQYPEARHGRAVPGDHARFVEDAPLAEEHDDMVLTERVGVGEPDFSLINEVKTVGCRLMVVVGTRHDEVRSHVQDFPPGFVEPSVGNDRDLLCGLWFCGHGCHLWLLKGPGKKSGTFYVNCCTGYIVPFRSTVWFTHGHRISHPRP